MKTYPTLDFRRGTGRCPPERGGWGISDEQKWVMQKCDGNSGNKELAGTGKVSTLDRGEVDPETSVNCQKAILRMRKQKNPKLQGGSGRS